MRINPRSKKMRVETAGTAIIVMSTGTSNTRLIEESVRALCIEFGVNPDSKNETTNRVRWWLKQYDYTDDTTVRSMRIDFMEFMRTLCE
jgi:hypothetical protein